MHLSVFYLILNFGLFTNFAHQFSSSIYIHLFIDSSGAILSIIVPFAALLAYVLAFLVSRRKCES